MQPHKKRPPKQGALRSTIRQGRAYRPMGSPATSLQHPEDPPCAAPPARAPVGNMEGTADAALVAPECCSAPGQPQHRLVGKLAGIAELPCPSTPRLRAHHPPLHQPLPPSESAGGPSRRRANDIAANRKKSCIRPPSLARASRINPEGDPPTRIGPGQHAPARMILRLPPPPPVSGGGRGVGHQYIPPPGDPADSFSFSFFSATRHSVVSSIDPIEAAFCRAERVTLAGSTIPAATRSSNLFVTAL